jgi:hypothetical protein
MSDGDAALSGLRSVFDVVGVDVGMDRVWYEVTGPRGVPKTVSCRLSDAIRHAASDDATVTDTGFDGETADAILEAARDAVVENEPGFDGDRGDIMVFAVLPGKVAWRDRRLGGGGGP